MLFTFHQIVPRRVEVLHISMSQKKKTENSTHIILYYNLCRYTKTCIQIRHRTRDYTNTSKYIQFKCFYLPETLKNDK